MRLRRLEIQALPGITPGFTVDGFADGVNLVVGPNAIGKSSLIRALGYLIAEPAADDPQALALRAEFDDGGRWSVRRAGSQWAWERDGRPVQPPPLPGREVLHCYWLAMEDLLRAEDARDAQLVAELRRALAGGYDLQALRAGAFLVGPRAGQAEQRALREALRRLRNVEAQQAALRSDEDRLPELEQRICAARHAAARLAPLQRALSLHEVVLERERLEQQLGAYPDGMERVRGDEAERLTLLQQRRLNLEQALCAARQRCEEAAAALRTSGLSERRPQRRELEAAHARLEVLRERIRELEIERRRYAQAAAAQEQARMALGRSDGIPELHPVAISEAERIAARLYAAERRCAELRAELETLEAEDPDGALASHEQATSALRAWLSSGRMGRRHWTALAVAAAGTALAAGFGALVGLWFATVAALFGLGGVGYLAALLWPRQAAAAQQTYLASGLAPPLRWEAESVQARLGELEERLLTLRQARTRAQWAASARQRLVREEEAWRALQTEAAALAERLGFDPGLTALGFDHFVRRAADYFAARRESLAAQASIEGLERAACSDANALEDFLCAWGIKTGDDLPGLSAGLKDLEARFRMAMEALAAQEASERERTQLSEQLEQLQADEAALYRELGLESGERAAVDERVRRLQAWRELWEARRSAELRETELRMALVQEPELLERVAAGAVDELREALAEAQAAAGRLEGLLEERARIETRLRQAEAGHALEEAAAAVQQATDALEERYHETLLAEAGQFLLDTVEQEHRSEHEPIVLRRAREWFQGFTHHAWDVELHPEHGLIARDLRQEARRTLAELSSGTRMQLLLAVRMAWLGQIEQGRRQLPLFLDEALTLSDEQRFAAVVHAIHQLVVEEGRQVFYLSARRHEVSLWREAMGSAPQLIDLSQIRFGVAQEPAFYALAERAALPPPADSTPEAYAARLGIAPVDPWQAPGELPVFHLLRDDLPTLHLLMDTWCVQTLGQLEALLNSTAGHHALPEAHRRRCLAARCRVARAWCAAYRQGRGRPVDRRVLESSGLVSAVFIDEVGALAELCDGNAAVLIEALRQRRVARFRSANIDALESWLQEHGYLDPQPVLDAAERERQVLMETADVAAAPEVRVVLQWLEAGQRAVALSGLTIAGGGVESPPAGGSAHGNGRHAD